MATKLKPWYQVVTPREDLRENRPLDASEFAVHLDQIRDRKAHEDYVKPDRFFQRTYLTKSLMELSSQVLRRLSGIKVETSAVFNMATQFGGGKTHSLLALYHLAKSGPVAKEWQGVDSILLRAQIPAVPKAQVAVFVGTEFDVLDGRGESGEPKRKTPWGEIAWQLGGQRAFDVVAKHDADGIAPGGDVIRKMLPDGPCLILMDEVLNYTNRARKSGLGGQFYSFMFTLTRMASSVDQLVVCVSIPASEMEMTSEDEREYQQFKKALDSVGKAISMSNEGEVTEIVRRRLFEWQGLPEDGRKASAAYAEWARDHASELANVNSENIAELFKNCYPFHPSVISVFERKWQSLPRFQRTRGVLRLLALWVSRAYRDGYDKVTGEPLIQLGSAPLYDPTFCDSVFEQLGEDKLKVPVNTDIAGKSDSHAIRLDNEATPEVRKARLHQKVATTIFFESNGGQSQTKADATVPEIRTALGGPDFNLAEVETILEGLTSTCYYLVWDRNKYRFGLKPNLNQMLVQSRGNVKPKDIDARIREEIEALFKDGAKGIDRKHAPQRSNDVPDRPQLTLVVMGMDTPASDAGTTKLVEEIIRSSGTSGRTYKSGLVFVVPDSSTAAVEAARNLLAWEDIDADDEAKKRLEDQVKTLQANIGKSARDLREALFRSFRNVYLLGKDNQIKHHDLGKITSSGIRIADLILEELDKKDEVVPAVGSSKLLKFWPPAFTEWATKDVRDAFFASPALPRLSNPDSIKRTIADGVSKGDLGYARRKSGGGLSLLKKPGESLAEHDVEISEDICILKAEDAQKLVEPPRLAKLTLDPARVEIRPGEVAVFGVKGTDQYGQSIAISGCQWSVPSGLGGSIDQTGKFTAGTDLGAFSVVAVKDGCEGRAGIQIVAKTTEPSGGGGTQPKGQSSIKWSGTVPPQKWMNFYTKVVGRFANTPGLRISVSFSVPSGEDQSRAKLDETRAALKELGLDDSVGDD